MNWLRGLMLRWLGFHQPSMALHDDGVTPLHFMAHRDNPDAFSVVPIRNGFLVCRRKNNPNGPDPVEAVFVASADELGSTLLAEMVSRRLVK